MESESGFYGTFVWACRALNRQKRRFPARADATSILERPDGSLRVYAAAGSCVHGTGYSASTGRNTAGCNTSILTYGLRPHGFMYLTPKPAALGPNEPLQGVVSIRARPSPLQ
jgi:hypothetical protein